MYTSVLMAGFSFSFHFVAESNIYIEIETRIDLPAGAGRLRKIRTAGFYGAAFLKGDFRLFSKLRYDIRTIREKDPAARNSWEVFFLYSGLHALIWYRASHWFWTHHCRFLARMLSQWGRWFTGIEIHPGAVIGKGLFIDHGSGVVIGETTVIGDDCTIYQGVTLGGPGKDHGKRHPTLGNNVLVGSGARILGPFQVGDNSRIAAGAVVLNEVPPNSTAVGGPARIVRRDGQKLCQEMDQVHVKDPLSLEICRMRHEIRLLSDRLAALEPKEGKEEQHENL